MLGNKNSTQIFKVLNDFLNLAVSGNYTELYYVKTTVGKAAVVLALTSTIATYSDKKNFKRFFFT